MTYSTRITCLLDGRQVTISDDPATWPKVGETAIVPNFAVVPDPTQPRDTSSIAETEDHKAFAESIKIYGQGMIMQVRPLTETELLELADTFPKARYRIVDGERRYHASGLHGAGLDYLEITVREYGEPKEVFLRQVILNTMQLPLNTPDLARALARIQREHGVSGNKLSSMVPMSQPRINDHLNLANLPHDLLDLTNQEKYGKKRFGIRPAVALSKLKGENGETDHDYMRRRYEEMRRLKITGAGQQEAYFEQFQPNAVQAYREKREPKRRRNRVTNYLRMIEGSDLLEMQFVDIKRMLSTASHSDRQSLSRRVKEIAVKLGDFARRLEQASEELFTEQRLIDERKRESDFLRPVPPAPTPKPAEEVVQCIEQAYVPTSEINHGHQRSGATDIYEGRHQERHTSAAANEDGTNNATAKPAVQTRNIGPDEVKARLATRGKRRVSNPTSVRGMTSFNRPALRIPHHRKDLPGMTMQKPMKPPASTSNGFTPFTTQVWNPSVGSYELTKVERRSECERMLAEKLFWFLRAADGEVRDPPSDFPTDLLEEKVAEKV